MTREHIISEPKYHLGLCQRFTRNIHGFNEESSPQIYDHYLCVYLFQYHSEDDLNFALNVEEKSLNQYKRKPTYHKKITKITIEIIETDVLQPGNETVAIYKTFWLRIFQRKVRKWIALKNSVRAVVETNQIHKMLLHREFTGQRLKSIF
jgi:hypothetical protein